MMIENMIVDVDVDVDVMMMMMTLTMMTCMYPAQATADPTSAAKACRRYDHRSHRL